MSILHGIDEEEEEEQIQDSDDEDEGGGGDGDIKMTSFKKMKDRKIRDAEVKKQISVDELINKHRIAALIRMRIESLITTKTKTK